MNRYAAHLLRQAVSAFEVATEDARVAVLPLLDAFVAAPNAITFLNASRALTTLKRNARVHALSHRVADRVFVRAQETLAQVTGVDAQLLDALNALPVDPQAGARLHALAHMLTAYQELAGRSEAAAHALRKQFDALKAKGNVSSGKRKGTARLGA